MPRQKNDVKIFHDKFFLSPKKMCVCLCLCVCLCVNKCVSMYVFVCVCVFVCVFVYVIMCVCFCVYAYIHVCVFVYKNVIHHRMALTTSSSFNLVIENIFKNECWQKTDNENVTKHWKEKNLDICLFHKTGSILSKLFCKIDKIFITSRCFGKIVSCNRASVLDFYGSYF